MNFFLAMGYDQEDAEGNVEFLTGHEADTAFLAADGMLLEGLLEYYTKASVSSAGDVRGILEGLGLTLTVPERHYEKPKKPKKKPALGKHGPPGLALLLF